MLAKKKAIAERTWANGLQPQSLILQVARLSAAAHCRKCTHKAAVSLLLLLLLAVPGPGPGPVPVPA